MNSILSRSFNFLRSNSLPYSHSLSLLPAISSRCRFRLFNSQSNSPSPSSSSSSSSSSVSFSSSSASLNIPPGVLSKVGSNLHLLPAHPLSLISSRVQNYFAGKFRTADGTKPLFSVYERLAPRVSVEQNFDDLLVPADHVSRRLSDTFYFSSAECLRTHTSAHQRQFLASGDSAFLVIGDCYRRDEIDSRHYPVFHQVEGVRLFESDKFSSADVVADLQSTLSGLVDELFGPVEKRWNSDYFPFTDPSFELEIFFNGGWMEVLGSGVIRPEIIKFAKSDKGNANKIGWAFGIGLERLAMILYEIPDIRLFWSTDPRFTQQFSADRPNVKFQQFSRYPACHKDISFWVNSRVDGPSFHENDFSSLVRELAGDIVEKVEFSSKFIHPKTGAESRSYRIHYRSLSRSLTNQEIDQLQRNIRKVAELQLNIKLR